MWQSFVTLLQNFDYILLSLNYALIFGLCQAMASVMGEMFESYVWNLTEISYTVGASFVAGMVGCFFFGYLVDLTRAYRVLIIVMSSLSVVLCVILKFALTDWHSKPIA